MKKVLFLAAGIAASCFATQFASAELTLQCGELGAVTVADDWQTATLTEMNLEMSCDASEDSHDSFTCEGNVLELEDVMKMDLQFVKEDDDNMHLDMVLTLMGQEQRESTTCEVVENTKVSR